MVNVATFWETVMTITILGLGPGDPKYLTEEAKNVLNNIDHIFVRTTKDPSLSAIPKYVQVSSFDNFYEIEHAEGVYIRIAQAIIEYAQNHDVVYAVPGDPLIGEYSVGLILKEAKQVNIPVKMIHGVSFFEPLFGALRYDPFNGIQIIMADELVSSAIPNINPDVAVLITMIIWPVTTSILFERISKIYPPTQVLTIVERAGAADEKLTEITLEQLKSDLSIHPLSCIFIPKSDTPSIYRVLSWIKKLPRQTIDKKMNNELIAILSSIDVDKLGTHLRGVHKDLEADIFPDLNQAVRWKTIQYLIGRFIADDDFRDKFVKDSKQIFDEYGLSEREKLLLTMLGEWDATPSDITSSQQ